MKKIIGISLFLFFFAYANTANAQSKASKVGQDIKKGAKKAGNKTAEVASKGKARVTDQKLKDKYGPNGETIYIDNHARYYWIDKHGRRHYVTEGYLKAKSK